LSRDDRLESARTRVRTELLAARNAGGHWTGELSSSALSTATAVAALAIVKRWSKVESRGSNVADTPSFIPQALVDRGLRWLAENANPDGGWGDTTRSVSNLSTTTLAWSAFGAVTGADQRHPAIVARAGEWIARRTGGTGPEYLAPAITARYGEDRTFSAPILTLCALAGRLGQGRAAWRRVLPLPFELAACPHRWFAALRLPVVSYALPALIAIGQARHHHRPTRNPLTRVLRGLTRARTLRVLTRIQPAGGGFLEATPLTSFVVMSLAGSGQADHAVTRKGVEFLINSARPDGSWPIDTNLATWLTTLSVNALGKAGAHLAPAERSAIREWLLRQQYAVEHPYTHAAPGGWAWTDLPGGVPDADDTAGALLALKALGDIDERVRAAAEAGVRWLLDLQNRDGGVPTFCRGWGALPFDRSAPDLTAHAVQAWQAWLAELPDTLRRRISEAVPRAIGFLARAQRRDGSWAPLWFGNQDEPGEENPTYGTSRVLLALGAAAGFDADRVARLRAGAVKWLLKAQRADGSWSGFLGGPPSVEETALAVEALAGERGSGDKEVLAAVANGAEWLVKRIEAGGWTQPAPIGFYFARLWYFEKMYPLIFAVGALTRAAEASEER
jgi:squalene-hopene/tetraprenyl-beta-curcumene cyclase